MIAVTRYTIAYIISLNERDHFGYNDADDDDVTDRILRNLWYRLRDTYLPIT